MTTHSIDVVGTEEFFQSLNPYDFDTFYVSGTIPDTIPPVITVISPLPGATITPTTQIVVDVTDLRGFVAVWLWVHVGGDWEVIWADNFGPRYSESSRVAITNGYRYTLRRSGAGWYTSPTFHAVAVDIGGNVT